MIPGHVGEELSEGAFEDVVTRKNAPDGARSDTVEPSDAEEGRVDTENEQGESLEAGVMPKREARLLSESTLGLGSVCFSGEGPFSIADMKKLAAEMSNLGEGGSDSGVIWIIIGRNNYDRRLIEESICYNKVKYASQEAYLKFLISGREINYYRGDPRIDDHPGLRYLSRLGFKWPDVEHISSTGQPLSQEEIEQWEDESFLKKLGYNVEADTAIDTRRNCLSKGVKIFGLKKVAYFLAWLVRRNHKNPNMQQAIGRWRDDLRWLKREHYDSSRYSFRWPSE